MKAQLKPNYRLECALPLRGKKHHPKLLSPTSPKKPSMVFKNRGRTGSLSSQNKNIQKKLSSPDVGHFIFITPISSSLLFLSVPPSLIFTWTTPFLIARSCFGTPSPSHAVCMTFPLEQYSPCTADACPNHLPHFDPAC